MVERTYITKCGDIHYWVKKTAEQNEPQLKPYDNDGFGQYREI